MTMKILNVIVKTIKAIVTLFIVFVVSTIFIQRISDNKINLGGISIYTIITQSMEPKYNVGDMVFSKKVDTSTLKVGDDVVYMGKEGDFSGKIVTHQIIKIEVINNVKYYHTKGINNNVEDPRITNDQIMGKVFMKGRILSLISKIINNEYGFYFVIFVPFVLLVSMEIIDIVEEKKQKGCENNEQQIKEDN